MVWGRGLTFFFCMWLYSYPCIFIEMSILSLFSWHPCWKPIDHGCTGLFLDSKFYSIDLCVYSYASLISCIFIVSFKSGKCESFNFVLWSFWKSFCLFCICLSMWILGCACQLLQNKIQEQKPDGILIENGLNL